MGDFLGIKDKLRYGDFLGFFWVFLGDFFGDFLGIFGGLRLQGNPQRIYLGIGCPEYSIAIKEIAFPASELPKFSPAAR